MTSLATLNQRIATDYTRDPSYRIWATAVVDRACNKGYTWVQQELGYENRHGDILVSSSQSAGDYTYSLPSEVNEIRYVMWNDVLIERMEDEGDYGVHTATGVPSGWYVMGGVMYLSPVPITAGTLEVVYTGNLTEMTSGVGSTLPTYFDDAICAYGAYSLMLGVDKEKAMTFLEHAQRVVDSGKTSSLWWANWTFRQAR